MKNLRITEKDIIEKNKNYKKAIEDIVIGVVETAIINKNLSIEDLNQKPMNEIMNILHSTINNCTNESGSLNQTIIYTDSIITEASAFKDKNKYKLSIVLYATAIEHMLNDIIHKALINKYLTHKEIENIMRLDIESKRTWLFPLIGIPRLSKSCSINIKAIADKRNEFIHYKWKGKFEEELEKENEIYKNLCYKATKVISILKRYKTNNLVSTSKIKKILKNKNN